MIGRIVKWLFVFVVLGSGGYFAYKYAPISEEGAKVLPKTGTVGRVEKADIVQKVSVAGHVQSARTTEIRAPFDGYIKAVFVRIGDKVKQGDPLISITETLNVIGHEVYPIRAPFVGMVTQVFASVGQNVLKDQKDQNNLLRVDDFSRIFVYADVPEADYNHLQAGFRAAVKAPAILNTTYHGKVLEKALASNSQNNWSKDKVDYSVKLEISDPDLQLKPGMSVVADITVGERKNVLSLSLDFVERDNDKYFVTKTNGEKVFIKVGIQDDGHVEIIEGLKEGDVVKQIDFLSGG